MTKIKVSDKGLDDLKNFKAHRVYVDDNFIIFHWNVLDEMWVRNDVGYTSMKELPDSIKDEVLKELI